MILYVQLLHCTPPANMGDIHKIVIDMYSEPTPTTPNGYMQAYTHMYEYYGSSSKLSAMDSLRQEIETLFKAKIHIFQSELVKLTDKRIIMYLICKFNKIFLNRTNGLCFVFSCLNRTDFDIKIYRKDLLDKLNQDVACMIFKGYLPIVELEDTILDLVVKK